MLSFIHQHSGLTCIFDISKFPSFIPHYKYHLSLPISLTHLQQAPYFVVRFIIVELASLGSYLRFLHYWLQLKSDHLILVLVIQE